MNKENHVVREREREPARDLFGTFWIETDFTPETTFPGQEEVGMLQDGSIKSISANGIEVNGIILVCQRLTGV